MSKRICVLILFTLFSFVVNAQNTVKGVVTTKDGSAIPGVSVLVKGTKIGTQTAPDGSFTITVPANSNTLVISAVGFTRQEIPIGGQSSINVSLETATSTLTDVVVIGYGTARKKDLTGSIGQVT
ncbi:MAG: carboxypeptidase-like regulatory domain-containing protein, partial [Bacteroidia bacterium]